LTHRPVHEETFEAHRSHLLALAYRMTGSVADAEDIVQDAYIRWERIDVQSVRQAKAFLSKTVTRLCLDSLKSARARRETYVGPWLPEPVVGEGAMSVEGATAMAQDISMALMMALERLSPLERAAFLLHEVFDSSYSDVAATLGRSESACRQLVSRARAHVQAARPRYQPTQIEHERVVQAFGVAVATGDTEALHRLLAEDAVLYPDGGGRVVAALRPIHGCDRVTRFLLGASKKFPFAESAEFLAVPVNGIPGFVIREDGQTVQTMAFDVRDGRIVAVYVMRNPDKLQGVQRLGA
jgi:RNA polymerase sigma-70 factor (ECF subfamily)